MPDVLVFPLQYPLNQSRRVVVEDGFDVPPFGKAEFRAGLFDGADVLAIDDCRRGIVKLLLSQSDYACNDNRTYLAR